jgi:hypothetical protein
MKVSQILLPQLAALEALRNQQQNLVETIGRIVGVSEKKEASIPVRAESLHLHE